MNRPQLDEISLFVDSELTKFVLFQDEEAEDVVWILEDRWGMLDWPLISNARTGEKAKEISKSKILILKIPELFGARPRLYRSKQASKQASKVEQSLS